MVKHYSGTTKVSLYKEIKDVVNQVKKGSGLIRGNRRFTLINKEKYVVAFLVTTLVFVVGIFVGSEITRSGTGSFLRAMQMDLLEGQSLEVEASILGLIGKQEDKCAYLESRLPAIVKKKVEIGRKFDLGNVRSDERELLSSQFVVSLGKYFVFNELQKQECNLQKPEILFFKDESEASRQQAKVLDNIVFKLGDINILVFTFHVAFKEDQEIIRLFYSANNVTTTPAIIIKGVKYEGFQPLEKVTDVLCESYANNYTVSICKQR